MSLLRSLPLWISATILVVIPMVLSLDYGGILAWSQYMTALAVLVAFLLSLFGLLDTTAFSKLSQHQLLIPLGVLFAWAFFQTLPLSPGLVQWLSPGSYAAYTKWLSGLLPGEQLPTSFPISVSVADTAHTVAFAAIVLAITFTASIVFHSRARITFMLSAIALTGLSVAVVGLMRKINPELDWWFVTNSATSFGGYVNRNNAALMLNLGMAASLGLLSWRMMALHSVEVDDPEFEFNDLISLISDRDSLIGILSASGCVTGLLVNGSRGGVVAALIGFLFAFGYVRPRRGRVGIPVVAVVVGLAVAIMTVPFNLSLTSLMRLEMLSEDAKTLQSDGRLLHWQDGWSAALSYLPAGSGVSTYRFAYLPYQNSSLGPWFEHADNLWLELFLEMGFIGVAAAVAAIAMVVISLRRLGESADPLDQGIRVAAWYAVSAVAVSQLFDFGLLMPANLIAVCILAAAVVSRDIANGGSAVWQYTFDEHPMESEYSEGDAVVTSTPREIASNPRRLLTSRYQQLPFSIGLAVVMTLVALWPIGHLRRDAETESLTRRVAQAYRDISLDPVSLDRVEELLEESTADQSDLAASMQLASVQRDQGRLAETLEWRPDTLDQAADLHRATNPDNRSIPYPPPAASGDRDELASLKHYQNARDTALETLRLSPLSQTPRATLLQLEPVLYSAPPADSPILIDHLMRFYDGEPTRMLRLGHRALSMGRVEQAIAAYRRAAELSAPVVGTLMPLIRDDSRLTLEDIIPPAPQAMELAAAEVLNWPEPDDLFLRQALQRIKINPTAPLTKRAQTHDLLARIHYRLKRINDGLAESVEAIRLESYSPAYRLTMIDQLLRADRRQEALQQARAGRDLLPQIAKFQEVIDQIAALERQVAPAAKPVPLPSRADVEALLK